MHAEMICEHDIELPPASSTYVPVLTLQSGPAVARTHILTQQSF
jgi:hypothetical protein